MGSLLQGAQWAAAPASARARRGRRPGRCYCLEGRGSGGAVRSPRARGGGGEPRRRGSNDLPPRLPRLPERTPRFLSRPRGTHAEQEAAAGQPSSARGVDRERRRSQGASPAASESPAGSQGTTSPPVSSFFPSRHLLRLAAPGMESQGLRDSA